MNWVPTMVGTIERRLLVNYRVDPEELRRILPAPFRPQIYRGSGLAGICLIRLGSLRPAGMPRAIGLTSENAAHRIAVDWDGPQGPCSGVFIPRRDTASRAAVLLGGRLFPGQHFRAQFEVDETDRSYQVSFASLDRSAHVAISAEPASGPPSDSVFATLGEASKFFKEGSLGYSVTERTGRFEALELQCDSWAVRALRVRHVESTFFEDESLFPSGSVEFDSAFVMRDIPATWHARAELKRVASPDLALTLPS